jgi:hypothetical protein
MKHLPKRLGPLIIPSLAFQRRSTVTTPSYRMNYYALSEVCTLGVSVLLQKLELRNCIYTVTITHGVPFFKFKNTLVTVRSPLF